MLVAAGVGRIWNPTENKVCSWVSVRALVILREVPAPVGVPVALVRSMEGPILSTKLPVPVGDAPADPSTVLILEKLVLVEVVLVWICWRLAYVNTPPELSGSCGRVVIVAVKPTVAIAKSEKMSR